MWLTRVAIKRPAFVTMVFLFLAVAGIISLTKMGVNLLPNIDFPMIVVLTGYPGAGPKEVESMISRPMEDALISLNRLKSIRSYNFEGMSVILLEFQMTENVNNVIGDVQRKVDNMSFVLPEAAKKPIVDKMEMTAMPILRLSVTSTLPDKQFYDVVKNDLLPRLQQIDGVAAVEVRGGVVREIHVEVDGRKLQKFGLSIGGVAQAMQADNMDFPAGTVYGPQRRYITRLAGKVTNLHEMSEIPVFLRTGGAIKLGDIARVSDTHTEDQSIIRLNGTPSIGLVISKASGANAVAVSAKVRSQIDKILSDMPGDMKYTIGQDITQFTKHSLTGVAQNLVEALIMVALVLLVFLHSWRSSFIVLLAIPTSMITAMIFLFLSGASLNLISLMALGLVIGILVDDSIVVLENIYRHLAMGKTPEQAALDGRTEIGLAAMAITLVDVVVFLPIAFISGIIGKIFLEFSVVIVSSTLVSLLVSFTLTPMLASRWASAREHSAENMGRFGRWFEGQFATFRAFYGRVLTWSLNHRKSILGFATLAFFGAIGLVAMGLVSFEFVPGMDRGEFSITLQLPTGVNLAETDSVTREVEHFLRSQPEVEKVYTTVGMLESVHGAYNISNAAQITVTLTPKEDRKKVTTTDFMVRVDQFCKNYPGLKATCQLIGMFGTSDEQPIMYEVQGTDMDSIAFVAEQVKAALKSTKGTRDVMTTDEQGFPEFRVEVDREAAAARAISVGEIGTALTAYYTGTVATQYDEGNRRYDTRVILDPASRHDPEYLEHLPLQNHMGSTIELGSVAKINNGTSPAMIARKNRLRTGTVVSNLADRPLGDVQKDMEKKLKSIHVPKGVTIFAGGNMEMMGDMLLNMSIIMGLAMLFVFMVMVALFESYAHPFTIMFSIPMAFIGSILGLALLAKSISMLAMMGVVMVMGLVTKNAILLVDYTNTLRARGMTVREALMEAGRTRFRPIIMTTTTMVIGMSPMAFSVGAGSEFRSSMGVVLVFGLLSSLLLTLVLIPVIYTYIEGFRKRLGVKETFFDSLSGE